MTDEIFRPVPGFEGTYEVSNMGTVRSLERTVTRVFNIPGKTLSPGFNDRGYTRLTLCDDKGGRKYESIHALVLAAFVGPRPSKNHDICHNNGITTDNRLENLRYDTKEGNWEDRVKHGNDNIGEHHPRAKLTDDAVRQVRKYKGTLSAAELAFLHGVTDVTIYSVWGRRNWGHVV